MSTVQRLGIDTDKDQSFGRNLSDFELLVTLKDHLLIQIGLDFGIFKMKFPQTKYYKKISSFSPLQYLNEPIHESQHSLTLLVIDSIH